MDDYISREAVIAETRKPWISRAELRRRICFIPSADVRPVVRCKDCRHSYDEPGGRTCSYGPCVDCIVVDDFFCADGKRREGGADG